MKTYQVYCSDSGETQVIEAMTPKGAALEFFRADIAAEGFPDGTRGEYLCWELGASGERRAGYTERRSAPTSSCTRVWSCITSSPKSRE